MPAINRQNYHEDSAIYINGEKAVGVYLIEEGTVEIFRPNASGKIDLIKSLGPREIFGEVAFSKNPMRQEIARAKAGTICLQINVSEAEILLDKADNFTKGLYRLLAQNISQEN